MKYKDFILGVVVFLTAFVLVPQAIIYPVIFIVGLTKMLIVYRKGFTTPDAIIFLVLVLSSIIFIVGYQYADNEDSGSILSRYMPYTFLIAGTFYFSKLLNENSLKVLFYLLIMEIIVGIMEYLLGIPYIFVPGIINGETEYGSNDLLYFNRVYGLSSSISVFAQKVLVSLLLLHYLKFKRIFFRIFFVIIVLGFLVSFNRTAIVSAISFLAIYYIRVLNRKAIVIYFLASVPVVLVVMKYWENILYQFFRGKEDLDYSSRDNIFEYYVNFIVNNPVFGNYCQKLWYSPDSSQRFHAHNTYLQTISSLGLLVTLFLFLLIVVLILKKKSLLFVFPFLVYSLFQYGFFWGVSFLDVIFFTFLLNEASAKKQELNFNFNSSRKASIIST